MIYLLLFLAFITGVVIPAVLISFVLIGFFSDYKGAPFVPTSGKIIDEILEKAKLKKGQKFLELGSGDGRVVRLAVKKYKASGKGVDIHPMLIWYSKIVSHFQGLKNISFQTQDLFKTDIKDSDVIFLFLLPRTLKKLSKKLGKETKPKTLIISHGFKIAGWDKYLSFKIDRKVFPTYYYRKKN